jgi:hypothetical protein
LQQHCVEQPHVHHQALVRQALVQQTMAHRLGRARTQEPFGNVLAAASQSIGLTWQVHEQQTMSRWL